jgi:hypothetical protein
MYLLFIPQAKVRGKHRCADQTLGGAYFHLSSLGIDLVASQAKKTLKPLFCISWMQNFCIFATVSISGGIKNAPFS